MIAIIKRRWTRWAAAVVAGVALAGPAAAQTGPAGMQQAPPPIHTKNAALRLPVQIDERARQVVAEIRLYVRPAGGAWQLVKALPATATAFDFKADADGVYAFSFVSVDRRGQADMRKLDALPPDRVVIVDTTAPEVAAQPISVKGEQRLQITVRDENPDWMSLRVAYLAPDQSWQPLFVAAQDSPAVFRVPNPAVFDGKIRVTAADRAGNAITRDLDLGQPSPDATPKTTIAQGKPDPALFPTVDADVAVPPLRPVGYRDPAPGAAENLKIPEPIMAPESVRAPVIRNGSPPAMPPIPDVPPLAPVGAGPVIRNGDRTPGDTKMPAPPNMLPPAVGGKDDLLIIPPAPPKEDLRIDAPADIVAPPAPAGVAQTSALKPTEDVTPPAAPKTADTAKELAVPTPPPIPEPIFDGKPAPTHTILNSRTVTINYQVEGTRGDKRIDFWATADGGRTWTALRDDAAGVPPAKLTLPADGFYGIRIRPGAGSRPPEAGEDPDCVVEIDTTKPTVNLMQPTLGTGSDDGTMLITWTASDKNLLSNSVNLSYATKPDGPWNVIVSGYKNAGLYRWTMPAYVTGNVYIRLEVSDRAGNVGIHDLKSPVALESVKPRVKVLGVNSVK